MRITTVGMISVYLMLFVSLFVCEGTPTTEKSSNNSPSLLDIVEAKAVFQRSQCFEYTLQNECAEVVDETWVPKDMQDDVFELIQMNISDTRMFAPECRRSLIWVLCSYAFGGGDDCDSNDFIHGDSNDYSNSCEEVNERCGGPLLNCYGTAASGKSGVVLKSGESFSFPSSIPPIAVETCLQDPDTTITCCPDPFTRSLNTLECVVQCPPVIYDRQFGLLVANYICFCLSLLILIFSLVPYIFIPQLRVFPKYGLALSMLYMILMSICLNWGLLAGVELYVCGSDRESGSYTEFLESGRCAAQLTMWTFFMFGALYWFTLVNMYLHNLVFNSEPPLFKPFFAFLARLARVDDPNHRRNEILIHVGCLSMALILSLACSLSTFYTDSTVATIPAYYCAHEAASAGYLFWALFCCMYGTVLIVYFITLFALLRKGWVLLRFHLRIILFFGVSFIQFFIYALTAFYFRTQTDEWALYQQDYAECVALNPRNSEELCELEEDGNFWWFVLVMLAGSAWPGIWGIIGFVSTQTAMRWWWTLITKREIVRGLESTASHTTTGENKLA